MVIPWVGYSLSEVLKECEPQSKAKYVEFVTLLACEWFARLGIKTTWFIPGHSIETFPAEMKAVAEAGHEIGIHGYSPPARTHSGQAA